MVRCGRGACKRDKAGCGKGETGRYLEYAHVRQLWAASLIRGKPIYTGKGDYSTVIDVGMPLFIDAGVHFADAYRGGESMSPSHVHC
jgi:hypothetical protein